MDELVNLKQGYYWVKRNELSDWVIAECVISNYDYLIPAAKTELPYRQIDFYVTGSDVPLEINDIFCIGRRVEDQNDNP